MLKKLLVYIFSALLVFPSVVCAVNFEQHEMLFLLEEAYTQDKDEPQFEVTFDYQNKDEWEGEAEAEYGLTNRLQVIVEMPFSTNDLGNPQFGNIKFGVDYALLKDEGVGLTPELTVGVGFAAPTGPVDMGWQAGPSLRFAKIIREGLYLHALVAADIRVESGITDLSQWKWGAGIAWEPIHTTTFTFEYLRKDKIDPYETTFKDWGSTEFMLASFSYKFINEWREWIVGLGFAQSVDGSDDKRVIFRSQIEW